MENSKTAPGNPRWERLIEVYDFHDRPQEGTTMFRGEVRLFQARFDEEADFYTDLFFLMTITPDLLRLREERDAIWRRMSAAAFREGVFIGYPALGEDRGRLAEVTERLGLAQDQSTHASGDIRWIGPGRDDYLARWVEVDANTWPGPSLSHWERTHHIENLLGPLVEGGTDRSLSALAAETIEAQARASSWEFEHLGSGSVDEVGWIEFFEAGYEAIGKCEAALEAYAVDARSADLAGALIRVTAVLNRRPSLTPKSQTLPQPTE